MLPSNALEHSPNRGSTLGARTIMDTLALHSAPEFLLLVALLIFQTAATRNCQFSAKSDENHADGTNHAIATTINTQAAIVNAHVRALAPILANASLTIAQGLVTAAMRMNGNAGPTANIHGLSNTWNASPKCLAGTNGAYSTENAILPKRQLQKYRLRRSVPLKLKRASF